MKIELAQKTDIKSIVEILRERCDWLKENNINQWGDYYYSEKYNAGYFDQAMEENYLYVLKDNQEIIGLFLLKEKDEKYWKDNKNSYYIHHLATKIGYHGAGTKALEFIQQLAKSNSKKSIRLDCKKDNEKLNNYYRSQGFEYKGTGEVPYSHNLWEKEIM